MICKQNLETPPTKAMLNTYHVSKLSSNQCGSSLVQAIDAPLPLVWSLIRRFEHPQGYKLFVKKCTLLAGDGGIGSVREVMVTSGLPAGVSVERLDKLDDEKHVLKFSIIGGDHRLVNYSSTITLHEEEGKYGGKTVAIESYVVDIPAGSSDEDTCSFANTIIACNLRSLAKITEEMFCLAELNQPSLS
ncbi:abscisic acid receptor PYL12 isoform X2 [Cajanus cajan]|uniref:abscisic acid receptor PYL12 isoform X2 n=1 Tax=Cajanus cajan TaxID=3821 RepID=UPI00098DBC14|nr:abscisic acid receptor PYL12 isoform X2 [Cajanus cajan]